MINNIVYIVSFTVEPNNNLRFNGKPLTMRGEKKLSN